MISLEPAHKAVLVIFPCQHPYIALYKRNDIDAETPSRKSRDSKSGFLSSQSKMNKLLSGSSDQSICHPITQLSDRIIMELNVEY